MDRWYLHDGFSFLWLAALYFMGAVMKKYSWEKRVSPAFSLGGIALCALLSCGLKLLEQRWPLLDRSLVSSTYLTPTHVCSAVLYLLLFAGMTVPKWLRKVTAFAAPGAFAVYLLNCNSFIWDRFVVNRFGFLAERTLGEMVLTVLGTSAAFVLVSVTADALRQKLFRLLGVKKHAQNVTDGCYRWILRFVDLCKKSKMFHRE